MRIEAYEKGRICDSFLIKQQEDEQEVTAIQTFVS